MLQGVSLFKGVLWGGGGVGGGAFRRGRSPVEEGGPGRTVARLAEREILLGLQAVERRAGRVPPCRPRGVRSPARPVAQRAVEAARLGPPRRGRRRRRDRGVPYPSVAEGA